MEVDLFQTEEHTRVSGSRRHKSAHSHKEHHQKKNDQKEKTFLVPAHHLHLQECHCTSKT